MAVSRVTETEEEAHNRRAANRDAMEVVRREETEEDADNRRNANR